MTKMRANLVKNLKQNVVKVNFTKVNGEERTMNCTLHESVLPVATMSQKERKENKEVLDFFANVRDKPVGYKLACNNSLALSSKYSQFVS